MTVFSTREGQEQIPVVSLLDVDLIQSGDLRGRLRGGINDAGCGCNDRLRLHLQHGQKEIVLVLEVS